MPAGPGGAPRPGRPTFFTDEAGHPAAASVAPSGMPAAAELREACAVAGGALLDDLGWFEALTRYKEAAATALLIKRARRDGELPPGLERMVPALPRLLDEACELLAAAGSTRHAQGDEARGRVGRDV